MRIAVAAMEMNCDTYKLYNARFLTRFPFVWINRVFLVRKPLELAFPLKMLKKTKNTFYRNIRKILILFAFTYSLIKYTVDTVRNKKKQFFPLEDFQLLSN